MKTEHTAVVLSLVETGVQTLRALGRHGIKVLGYDYNPKNAGFRSKYCIPKVCPNPKTEERKLLELLLTDQKEEKKKILFPASDDFVRFVAKHRNELSASYEIILPDSDVIDRIISKATQYDLVRETGLPLDVPETYAISSFEEALKIAEKINYPALIKPENYLLFWNEFYYNKGLEVADKNSFLYNCKKIFERDLKIIVQEIIPGECTDIFESSVYFDKNSNYVGGITIQKLRQNPDPYGTGTLIVTTQNKDVEELSLEICRKLNWKGFANIEFKFDAQRKKYRFVEVNARVWLNIDLPEKLGLNFPLLQYLDLTNQKLERQSDCESGKKWIDMLRDLHSSFGLLKSGKFSLTGWCKSLQDIKAFGMFARDDLSPYFYSIKYGAVFLMLPVKFLTHFMNRKYEANGAVERKLATIAKRS